MVPLLPTYCEVVAAISSAGMAFQMAPRISPHSPWGGECGDMLINAWVAFAKEEIKILWAGWRSSFGVGEGGVMAIGPFQRDER